MAVRPPGWLPLRWTPTDGAWALILGVTSVTYFLVNIALSTAYFTATGGPPVSSLAVWGVVAVVVTQSAAICWRTPHPLAVFVVVYLLYLLAVALIQDPNFTVSATFLFALLNIIGRAPTRTWTVTVSAALTVSLALNLALAADAAGGLSPLLVLVVFGRIVPIYAAGLLAGLLYGSERRRAESERLRAELAAQTSDALRQARDSQMAAAAAAERNHMARELHDVAAHHLSGILLQARGAIRVQESDPALRAELLDSIRSESGLALQNLREVIGALRSPDEKPSVTGPTMSRLPDLLASVRTLHPSIDLAVIGEIDDLSPATSLACYRIIQESLTNARKHAPGSDVVIRIRRSLLEVVIEVANATTAVTTLPISIGVGVGFGLVGMRERATMLGGTFEAGPDPDGGWHTRAVLPVERVVA